MSCTWYQVLSNSVIADIIVSPTTSNYVCIYSQANQKMWKRKEGKDELLGSWWSFQFIPYFLNQTDLKIKKAHFSHTFIKKQSNWNIRSQRLMFEIYCITQRKTNSSKHFGKCQYLICSRFSIIFFYCNQQPHPLRKELFWKFQRVGWAMLTGFPK